VEISRWVAAVRSPPHGRPHHGAAPALAAAERFFSVHSFPPRSRSSTPYASTGVHWLGRASANNCPRPHRPCHLPHDATPAVVFGEVNCWFVLRPRYLWRAETTWLGPLSSTCSSASAIGIHGRYRLWCHARSGVALWGSIRWNGTPGPPMRP
jgi:hypothetical protein